MKKILFAIGFLLISTAELAAQSLSEIVYQKETILVDVRTPEECAQGNVRNWKITFLNYRARKI